MKALAGFRDMLFRRPLTRLILILVMIGILLGLSDILPNEIESSPLFIIVHLVLIAVGAVYSAVLIIRIIMDYMIRKPLNQLLMAQNITSLLVSYAVFIMSIIVILSLLNFQLKNLGLGYITYGQCGDSFSPGMIASDPYISNDYFYFTAVTFFTIGYGDICPMGLTKMLSVATGLIGNFVSVVLMAIVITLYLDRRARKADDKIR